MEYYPVAFKLSDGSIINVHIRDTCGQEIYDSVNENYVKKADGILLVFDISNKLSFEKVQTYYPEIIKNNCKPGIPILLLGNKTDLKEKRIVNIQDAIDLAVNNEYVYKETSCVNNENVADAFETIVEMWNINSKTQNINNPKKCLTDINLNNSNNSFSLKSKTLKKIRSEDDDIIFIEHPKRKRRSSC